MIDLQIGRRLVPAQRVAVAATLGCAAGCWVVAIWLMSGATTADLGSFPSFAALWISMMGAMMLPGAVPAVVRSARGGSGQDALLFAASYLAVWELVGGVMYPICRPHGTSAGAAVVIAAGLYESTAWKRRFRERCRASDGSGLEFARCCVGSSIGLMLVLIAVGVMSVPWMAVIAVVVLAQKVFPPKAALDVPLALAIVGLGVLIAVAPSAVPGLMPSM